MSTRPYISVIVVTYNSKPFIKECLEAVSSAEDGTALQTIVIDNDSVDGSSEIADQFPNVTVIRRDTNEGFASAVNIGLSLTESDYVLLLNPDAQLAEGSVEEMRGYLESHPDVVCVAPQLLDFDGTIQRSCREFPGVKTILGEFFILPWIREKFPKLNKYRMGYFDHRSARDVDQPMASCLLLRRAIIDKVGNLDESMPIFFNDVDLCRRIKDTGGRIVFYPSAKVYHYCGGSTRYMGVAKELHLARSMYTYMNKHSSALSAYLSGILLIIGFCVKAVGTAVSRILKG